MEMCDEDLGEPARLEGTPHKLDLGALTTVEHPAAQPWGTRVTALPFHALIA